MQISRLITISSATTHSSAQSRRGRANGRTAPSHAVLPLATRGSIVAAVDAHRPDPAVSRFEPGGDPSDVSRAERRAVRGTRHVDGQAGAVGERLHPLGAR